MKTILLSLLMLGTAILAAPETFTRIPSVKLAWDASDEPDIAGYRIHLGGQSGEYTTIIDVGLAALSEDGGSRFSGPVELPGTGVWFCAVTCYNSYGLESDYSNEISFSRYQPAAPTGLRMATVSVEVSSDLKDWESIESFDRPLAAAEFFRVVVTSAQLANK